MTVVNLSRRRKYFVILFMTLQFRINDEKPDEVKLFDN